MRGRGGGRERLPILISKGPKWWAGGGNRSQNCGIKPWCQNYNQPCLTFKCCVEGIKIGQKELKSSSRRTLIPIGIGSTIPPVFGTGGCDKSEKNQNSQIVGSHGGAISSLLAGVWSAITQRFSGGNLAPTSYLLRSQVANKKVNNLFKWGMGGRPKNTEISQ